MDFQNDGVDEDDPPGGRPVRRLVLDGWARGARMHLVLDGPAARSDS